MSRAIFEVALGERPATQLRKHIAADQLTTLAIRGTAYARHPAARSATGMTRLRKIRAVRCCLVAPGTIEASAVVVGAARSHAVALRMESRPGAWLVTAIRFSLRTVQRRFFFEVFLRLLRSARRRSAREAFWVHLHDAVLVSGPISPCMIPPDSSGAEYSIWSGLEGPNPCSLDRRAFVCFLRLRPSSRNRSGYRQLQPHSHSRRPAPRSAPRLPAPTWGLTSTSTLKA